VIHPKWLERHYRHMKEALRGLELGDHPWACYNAFVAVRSLILGLLGRPPHSPTPSVEALPALLKKLSPNPPEEVMRCARCLEKRLTDPKGEMCVKCADILCDYLAKLVSPSLFEKFKF